MTRRCSCSHVAEWSAFHVIDDGSNPRLVTYSLCLANCPRCFSTLAERSGHVFAARAVERAVPQRVFIELGG